MHDLLAQQTLQTPLFTLRGQTHWAKCVKCYDADTIHIVIAFNNTFARFRCRLQGIDTAEIRSKNPTERQHARTARDWLKSVILNRIIMVNCGEFDKYGRLLVNVYVAGDGDLAGEQQGEQHGGGPEKQNIETVDVLSCRNINQELIALNYAYVYDGGKRRCFEEWYKKI